MVKARPRRHGVVFRMGAGPPGLLLEGSSEVNDGETHHGVAVRGRGGYGETHHVNNRIAAYMLAIDRVAYTIRQRGIYA